MNIMMCYDGSEAARAALAVARRLAESSHAKLHLVQVARHSLAADGVAWSGSESVDIEKHRRAEEEDLALAAKLEGLVVGAACETAVAVLSGTRIEEELAWYARENAVDLLVLGCREHGAMHPGVGGTITRHMVESRVAPVLLGPLVPAAHVELRSIPRGCAVFTRDGYYLGDLERVNEDRFLVVHAGHDEHWFAMDDALELSMASGLRMAFDRDDMKSRSLPSPASAASPAPRTAEERVRAGGGGGSPWSE